MLTSMLCGRVSHSKGKEKINLNIQHNLKSCCIGLKYLASYASSIFDLKRLCSIGSANAFTNVNLKFVN